VIRFGNPVDLGDLWDFDAYPAVLERLAAVDEVDGIVLAFVGLGLDDPSPLLRMGAALRRCSLENRKPIALCLVTWQETLDRVAESLQDGRSSHPSRARCTRWP